VEQIKAQVFCMFSFLLVKWERETGQVLADVPFSTKVMIILIFDWIKS
jgi:hypothetical protein